MQYLLHIIVMSAIFVPSVVGYNLLFGRGKIMFFGQQAISLIAAYAFFIPLSQSSPLIIALFISILCTVCISLLFAWLALRLEADALGIMSIAMHLAVLAIVLNWTELTRGAFGIPRIPHIFGVTSTIGFAVVTVSIACLFSWLVHILDRSKLGRSLTALAENRFHAEGLGIRRTYVYTAAFLVNGLGSFVSNTLYPQYVGILHPSDYGFPAAVFFMMASIAGGSGNVLGCVSATVLLTLLKEGIRFMPLPLGMVGPLRLLLFGSILLTTIYIRRDRLFPKVRKV